MYCSKDQYMSHEIVNKLINMMGHKVLRQLLARIRGSDPCLHTVIADETTNIACSKQLNVSIRCVDNDYPVYEDSIGLVSTKASTLHLDI